MTCDRRPIHDTWIEKARGRCPGAGFRILAMMKICASDLPDVSNVPAGGVESSAGFSIQVPEPVAAQRFWRGAVKS